MSRINRFEKKIKKIQKGIQRQEEKMDELTDQLLQKKISEHDFSIKKEKITNFIRERDSRIRILQGAIVKEKRRLEEKKENN